jgi:hypothetical protein
LLGLIYHSPEIEYETFLEIKRELFIRGLANATPQDCFKIVQHSELLLTETRIERVEAVFEVRFSDWDYGD